jgi:hypothetical protein
MSFGNADKTGTKTKFKVFFFRLNKIFAFCMNGYFYESSVFPLKKSNVKSVTDTSVFP